jgi:hypothetical protein
MELGRAAKTGAMSFDQRAIRRRMVILLIFN